MATYNTNIKLELAYWYIKEISNTATILRKDINLKKIWVHCPNSKLAGIINIEYVVKIQPTRWYFTPYSFNGLVHMPGPANINENTEKFNVVFKCNKEQNILHVILV